MNHYTVFEAQGHDGLRYACEMCLAGSMTLNSNPSPRLIHPIILVHGLGARATWGPIEYFHGIPRRLRDAGNQVLIPQLTPWHTFGHRAEQLKVQIEAAYPDPSGRVNIIGHSMGGLDARVLASRLNFSHRIASVTTIGTPNRGSPLADLLHQRIPLSASTAINAVLKSMGSSMEAFGEISTAHMTGAFARNTPNVPGIAYYSATSRIPNPVYKNALPIFWLTHRLLKAQDGDNDGFVSVESARWGSHICTYDGDHYGQIGQILGRSRGLDHFQFFDEILARLRSDGF